MGFQQGLSGLSVAAKSLDAIGNNVANSGTVGFKSARGEFADVFAASLAGGGASQIGIGATLANVAQQFTQGNITATNNPLDVAINGGGFFRMSNNGAVTYSRNGQFLIDKSGFVVNAAGYRLQGYPASYASDPAGTIVQSTPTDIFIDPTDIQPKTTSQIVVGMNLDSRDKAYPLSGSLTGSAAPTDLNITAGTNDVINISVDGIAATVTIPPAAPYANVGALAAAVETAINTDATISAAGKSVTVGVSNGKLVITSDSTGPTSTVTVSGGNGATNLLGTAPVRVAGAAPFNMANPATYNSSTSATIYDTLGNPHVMTMYFVKAAAVGAGAPATASSQWDMYVSVEGTATSFVTAGGAAMPYSLYYDTSGKNLAPATPPTFSVDLTGLMAALIPPQTNTAASPMTFTVDQSATTQFGSAFGVNNMVQDGFTSGRLAGISISADGIIQGRYSNGQSKKMGQIVLAKFNNPNGLQSLGGNQWQETSASGASIIGAPGTGSNGVVQSAAVEESNTDLTAELVQMITQQRAYQANAQTIKTQDSVMQTLVNLR